MMERQQPMDTDRQAVARRCAAAAEIGALTFPQIVAALMDAGFESYAVDFRRAAATYYLTDGDSIVLGMGIAAAPVAPDFDAGALQAAIRDAQQLAPGYTYEGFCARVTAAGCAGYVVSMLGRRVVYLGRTAESHVEPFPA